jgi:hypothetical protein
VFGPLPGVGLLRGGEGGTEDLVFGHSLGQLADLTSLLKP